NANNNSNNSLSDTKQERFERIEKIERVESGDAISKELDKFKVYGLIFACSILSLLIFIAIAAFRPQSISALTSKGRGEKRPPSAQQQAQGESSSPAETAANAKADFIGKRYEIERITEELMAIFAQQPKVAKTVFS